MPIVGTCDRLGGAARHRLAGALDDDGEAAGLGHRSRIGQNPCGLGLVAALSAEAADDVNRLRLQTDMAQYRNAALHQKAHRLGHRLAAFELDAGGAGLGHDARGALERLIGTSLVSAEGHVDDDAGALGAAHRRRAMRDHHFHRHRQRALEAVDHHAEGIPDQQQIGDRVQQPRHRCAVGGQAHDRLAPLAAREAGGRQFLGG